MHLLIALAMLGATACGTVDNAEDSEAPSTNTSTSSTNTVPLTTTLAPTSTSTIEPTTTSSSTPAGSSEGILLALDAGIALVTGIGTTVVLEGRSIDFALPDLTGGVVFQESGQLEQEWPQDPVPIEWIPSMGADPVVLVDGAGANVLIPIQVAWIDDEPQLLYRRRTVLDEDDQIEHLVLHNLVTGAEQLLGIIGSYESDFTSVDVGGDNVLVSWVGYADAEGACAGVVDLAELQNLSADDWTGSICGAECCVYGPNPGRVGVSSGQMRTALSPDGLFLALIVGQDDGRWRLDEIDLETGSVRHVVDYAPKGGDWLSTIDYDGSQFLIGFTATDESRTVAHIDETGNVLQTIAARSASFWMVGS